MHHCLTKRNICQIIKKGVTQHCLPFLCTKKKKMDQVSSGKKLTKDRTEYMSDN